jgi:hypothetical protein
VVERREVVQNPILRLLTEPVRERPDARGKDERRIKDFGRLQNHRAYLLNRLAALPREVEYRRAAHHGRRLLWAGMHEDSLASTHTPHDLFSAEVGVKMKMAWRDGYVVEVPDSAISSLAGRIAEARTIAHRCDIYSVERLEVFAQILASDDRIDADWAAAPVDEAGLRRFNVRIAPLEDTAARQSIMQVFERLANADRLYLDHRAALVILGEEEDAESSRSLTLHSNEEPLPRSSLALGLRDKEGLRDLILTGSITRWEPVAGLQPTLPGEGPEPDVDLPELENSPVVGVIDGGYHARRYQNAIAWRQAPPLIADALAAKDHGNKVTSVMVDAHLWSNRLRLPQLHCRVGVVQAVPRDRRATMQDDRTLAHIEQAFIDHPDTHVWNLSANADRDCHYDQVSELGHGLAKLARRHNKLLVISAGNRSGGSIRLAPPADCESALVVAGRQHLNDGTVGGPCAVSRTGLGPEGMLKPETSWFSTLRVLGGTPETGTSFAAPLISRLAAHTWENLATPSPDMVKALLLNASDLPSFSHEMGFGSPTRPELPWNCPPHAAIVAWSADLTYMQRYYWLGIRIPPSLMAGDRFRGRAKLVAILNPLVNNEGSHYFQTRIEAGLYYRVNQNGAWQNKALAGCSNPHQFEIDARREDNKWDPVRVYEKDCRRTAGVTIPGAQPALRVGARMFWRDTFKYSANTIRDTSCKVTFVVMVESRDPGADTYNEFRRIMAETVESAVIEQDVEVDLES